MGRQYEHVDYRGDQGEDSPAFVGTTFGCSCCATNIDLDMASGEAAIREIIGYHERKLLLYREMLMKHFPDKSLE